MSSIYETLSKIDMGQKVKDVQGQKYIPWTSQWGELLKIYPNATFTIHEDDIGNPFFVSPMGVTVKVSVTIEDITRTLTYPVLNNYNKSLKVEAWSYTTKRGEVQVLPCTTFDINSAHMRCLTKCIALFGLGLHVYQDELHPEEDLVDSKQLQEIVNKIKEKNMSITEVCTAWQIPKIASLYASNFENMMQWLETQ